jgi:hypothetical protein
VSFSHDQVEWQRKLEEDTKRLCQLQERQRKDALKTSSSYTTKVKKSSSSSHHGLSVGGKDVGGVEDRRSQGIQRDENDDQQQQEQQQSKKCSEDAISRLAASTPTIQCVNTVCLFFTSSFFFQLFITPGIFI